MKKHTVELRFGIWGFEDTSHSDLTDQFGISPIVQHFKGMPVNPKLPQGKIAKENAWIIAPPEYKEDDDFETQMNSFIALAKDKMNLFQKLCQKYHCEFSCAIFLVPKCDDSTPSVHLGKEYNDVFGKLNVHFDLDLYC